MDEHDRHGASMKPYLVRAMIEWAEDSGLSPMAEVVPQFGCMGLPPDIAESPSVFLNVSGQAVEALFVDGSIMSFRTRFGGVVHDVAIPMGAIASVFSRETGTGMSFETSPQKEDPPRDNVANFPDAGKNQPNGGSSKGGRRGHLRLVK